MLDIETIFASKKQKSLSLRLFPDVESFSAISTQGSKKHFACRFSKKIFFPNELLQIADFDLNRETDGVTAKYELIEQDNHL